MDLKKHMDSAKWKIIKSKFSEVVDLTPDARLTSLENCDSIIKEEVENLLNAYEKSDGFIEKPILIEQNLAEDETIDFYIGKQIDNYLILEKIGSGGMGAVYLAEKLNSDFKQKVALKIIKRGMDSEAILKRFATERKILSRLKHHNIAELLDGGISSEGQPYFVMEFIDGKPLNEFCLANKLDLHERLELFKQICSAVGYAHRNLIIHRDLKPSNILVTNEGIPKLLDFGIAKLLSDEETETTITQHKMFTPEYASPEQILGKPVTTSSDAYSLGVILYEILSGERPYHTNGKTFNEIVKIVCDSPVTKPSEAITKSNLSEATYQNIFSQEARSISGDLDNIALKCLRKEPVERYSTVQQLIEDIERYLKGLPVLARPQTIKYRFGKYVKRHKVGVLAASLVLLSLIGGISVATWQTIEARHERAKAEQRFNDVRNLSKSVMFDLHQAIKDLPGSTPARELLINKSLEYLDKLALENQSDTSLQMELAEGYDQIANILGGLSTNHLGQREKALENFQKSLAIKEKLVEIEPQNVKFRQQLGASYFNIGNMYIVEGKPQESILMFEKAVNIIEVLQQDDPDNESFKYSLGKVSQQLGSAYGLVNRVDDGFKSAKKSVDIFEEIVKQNPDQDNLQSLAGALVNYAGYLDYQKDFEKSLLIYQQSFEISKQMIEKDPNNITFQRDYAVSYYRFSVVYLEQGEYPKALENAQKALELFKNLQKQDPQNEEANTLVTQMERWNSKILIKMGRAIEVIPILEKSLDKLEKQYAESPADKIIYFEIGEVKFQLGLAYKALAEKTKSTETKRKSCDYFQTTYKMYQEFLEFGYSGSAFNENDINQLTEEAKQCS